MITCKVVTPNKLFYEGEAESIVIPGYDGELGILENHAPLITMLSKGRLEVSGANPVKFEIEGGFAEVRNNNVMVFTEKVIS